MRVFQTRTDSIPCRGCGAKEAAPARHGVIIESLCRGCTQRFVSWCRQRDADTSKTNLNLWLARQLYLNAKRLKRYGVTGRCEAITAGYGALMVPGVGPQGGYQCGLMATTTRAGRRVCSGHADATKVQFTTSKANPYQEFKKLIADLCALDERFHQTMRRALALADRRQMNRANRE